MKFKSKDVFTVQQAGQFGVDFCVKVHIPQGLAPPGAMLEAQLEQYKPQYAAALASYPHQDFTIDGENIAIMEQENIGPDINAFVGLRHNGAPFGMGIVPPA